MEKRIKIYALILLALCLAVPAVDAQLDYRDTPMPEYLVIGTTSTSVNINYGDTYGILSSLEQSNGNFIIVRSEASKLSDPVTSSFSFYYYKVIRITGGGPQVNEITCYVNCVGAPEPTPSGAYITATVYNTGPNNLFYDYNVRCMPASGYFFAPLSFYSYGGQLPQCDLTSEQTAIQVRVWAGEDIPMYSCALSGSGGAPNFQYIQTVLSAPVYTGADVVNNQTVHDELDNLPNPVKPSGSSGGIVSGAWQPLAVKQNLTAINTPFSNIVDNYLHYFHFPEMATPETVKAELLNGTGNLTAPLYDSIDGLTNVFMILPNYVSGVLTGLISPISETVLLIKDIIYTLSDYVYNAMSVLYVFIPFIYLFIPDVIWWGLTIYLSYLVFAWLLTLLFGYDVISVFYIDPFVSWVRSRRGGV